MSRVSTSSKVQPGQKEALESYYFQNYARIRVHRAMLGDKIRTQTYSDAMLFNRHLFKGKVVLDVGSGTGILSMFAAKAGAARVISVECSNIADHSKKVIEDNHLNHIITVIKGKVEEVKLPDGIKKVDIIVSEWMGYSLLSESMLDSVIFARDKWLDKENGLLFPDRCSLFIAAIEDDEMRKSSDNRWNDVYGFDMTSLWKRLVGMPCVGIVGQNQVISTSKKLIEIDLYTVKIEDLSFMSDFHIVARKNGYFHGFITYFNVEFTKCHKKTGFDTSPDSPRTHWTQTVFYFEQNNIVILKGEDIFGKFMVQRNEMDDRDLHISIKTSFNGERSQLHLNSSYQQTEY